MSRLPLLALALASTGVSLAAQDSSALSEEVIPLRTDLVPERTAPPFELGNAFLSSGKLDDPIHLFTGATWQPSFTVFGQWRTGIGKVEVGGEETTELATRLDLFGNLQLSGTERILIGLRPLDDEGRFTRYVFEPSDGPLGDGFEDELNANVETFFFEGDFGELFPGLDPGDEGELDIGFSVGRQQITLQDGLLVNDRIDVLGLTRNSVLADGGSNVRWTALFAWDELHRGDNIEDEDAFLVGLTGEGDFPTSSLSFDLLFLNGSNDSDALFCGIGAVQRLGHWNTTFRALTSQPLEEETAATGRGGLLFAELSRNRVHSDDLWYANTFVGIDQFSSALRGPETGGPLGRTGVLFAAVGVGSFPAALGNGAQSSVGGALGYQSFLGDPEHRRQLILEVGGRAEKEAPDALGLGLRYQHAVGRRWIVRLDAFATGRETTGPEHGLRTELLLKL